MPVTVVTSPPFGGKGRYVREMIQEREAEGELGLIALDWTALFAALFPGEQSAFRDEAISDTGAPRLTGYTFEVVAAAIAARELRGYVLTQSPERAIVLADRFGGPLLEVPADPGDVADRIDVHMRRLGRTVARASRSAMLPRCRKAAVSYFRESHRLVGRAREVRRTRGGNYKVDPAPKMAFDRALFEKGLTTRGRNALAELKDLGNPEPSPADVMKFILRNRVED